MGCAFFFLKFEQIQIQILILKTEKTQKHTGYGYNTITL
jgi:hypothetical protein